MKKSLIVLQDGYKECGAASLLSIIRYYNGNISMSRLVEMTNIDDNGTNFYQIKQAALEIGLEAVGYKVDDINFLRDIKKPFICQVIENNYEHFIVVYEVSKKYLTVMDPACGERKIMIDEFKKLWTSYVMIFSPKKKLVNYQEDKYFNKIVIQVIKNNWHIVIEILLLSLFFTILSFVCAFYFEIIIDYILGTTLNNLLVVTFFFLIFFLMKNITNFFRNELLIFLNQKIDCSIFLDTFRRILLLPYSYYKNRTTGEIVTRVNDLVYVKNILNKLILTVCLDFVICLGCSVVLFIRNRLLFLLLMIIIIVYVVLFYLFRPLLKRYTENNQKNSEAINSYLIEMISGFETIKNMNLESVVNEKIEDIYIRALNNQFEYEQYTILEIFMKDVVSVIGILLVQFMGFYLVMNNRMSLSSLLTFVFLTSYIIDPIKNILDMNKEYFYAINSIKRINHLFEVKSEDLRKKTNYKLKGDICFRHLNFEYRDNNYVLKNISMDIVDKERILILGESGSGKSTLVKLLLKYYQVSRDSIYLDSIDINDISVGNIREKIACIGQNEILYNDTIKNNILMNRKISNDEFMDVVRLVEVDEFVKGMFLGYETILEENGLNLSGGQRQRIILARMLLKSSNIMIIDEGLNAIDVNLERRILKRIFSRYKNRTIIVVSHRVENIDLFERIVYFKNGSIVRDIKRCAGESI